MRRLATSDLFVELPGRYLCGMRMISCVAYNRGGCKHYRLGLPSFPRKRDSTTRQALCAVDQE